MNPPTSDLIDLTRFDVRDIPCRVKHGQIFRRWQELPVGQHFVLINDHDPIPLYQQFNAQFPSAFSWEYLLRGPEEFQVKITRLAAAEAATTPEKKTNAAIAPDTVFDVRPIPGRVKHAQIFQRWFNLPVNGYFVLLNDHDPVPLRYQLQAEFPEAFTWEYLENGPEEFRVKITKVRAVPAPPSSTSTKTAEADVVEIDARGFEPPEPLIRILNALENLPVGKRLRAITDRWPCHLFGEAEQRGFCHDSREQSDGSWITLLARA
jgi:uncharacterized protein (DUF2249 family)